MLCGHSCPLSIAGFPWRRTIVQANPIKSFQKNGKPLIIAHRGFVTRHQENTMAAVKAAIADPNCDGFEIDVQLTSDDQLMVVHDDSTLRLTGVDKKVVETPWADMKDLVIRKEIEVDGSMWRYDKTEKFCLLTEVLEEIKGKDVVLDIDFKPSFPAYSRRKKGTLTARAIREAAVEEQVICTGVDFFVLYCLEKELAAVFSGFQYDSAIPLWPKVLNFIMERNLVGRFVNANCAFLQYALVDDDTIRKLKKRNFAVGCYTLFPLGKQGEDYAEQEKWERETQRLIEMKVDWLVSDYPDKVHDLVWKP